MPLLAVRGNGPAGAYGFGAASGKADAMTAIASNTLSSDASTITFSSIPGTYDDLMVVIYTRCAVSGQVLFARFNSDANSNYSVTSLAGSGASAQSTRATSAANIFVTYYSAIPDAANRFLSSTFHILNYANSTNNKTTISSNSSDENSTAGYVEQNVNLWRSTSAITSIEFRSSSGQLKTGSVFALYGIKKAA